ncbi:DNA/RNA non-specific endonuclease [Bacteroides ovatus]|uniref:DNA/RNA non-specific endonuclease n=1 Tax=Bacteroides ovatus TaxID=28116 RepID=UPI001106D0A2|nr:DNA/RNA non-specific endonuclease [Bacteroides ovatus]
MTKALFKLFILFITCSTAISCSEQDSPELPDNSGNTNQGIASIDQTQINANGGGFIIRVKADGTWQASSSETWCTLSRTSGNGNGSISGYMKANTGAERSVIITITAGKEEAKFTLKQLAGNGSNPVPDPEKPSGYASMLEIPALKGGSMNQFITHTTKRNGKDYPTYSLEYSYKYKHSYWIAYRFDNTTGGNVGRNEAYKPDPELPSQYAAKHNDYTNSGYTRGHLCASSDRQYSKETNQQTFYMSNISPQSGNGFNQSGSAWNTGEDKVQAWGYNISRSTDTLYVVKGGTIGEGMIKGYIKNEIAIPKYFFMAVLFRSGDNYKAIGFYMPHENLKDDPDKKDPKKYLMSIDALEQETGIDFFHNLPDNIENTVEATYNVNDWQW